MSITFEQLHVGGFYGRPYLAGLWGYRRWHAIGRGVVTPAGSNVVILFVTEDEQQALTQYQDSLENDVLHMDGEMNHAADRRLAASSSSTDEVHLFFRERHHSAFRYCGRVYLEACELRTATPSLFVFQSR